VNGQIGRGEDLFLSTFDVCVEHVDSVERVFLDQIADWSLSERVFFHSLAPSLTPPTFRSQGLRT
jgi:hypothetical protein